LFYEKCSSFCGSNICPTAPYFKHPSLNKCVDDCPDGYTESGNNCVPTQLCHSTCDTCGTKNDATQCSACSSTLTSSLIYSVLTPPGSCSLPATNNAQLLLTVNKDTVLGTSVLKLINYNSVAQTTSGSLLSSLTSLYIGNIVDFKTLSSNTIIYNFDGLPVHQKLLVRARVLT
jgi:hypothetical protein